MLTRHEHLVPLVAFVGVPVVKTMKMIKVSAPSLFEQETMKT
jgi:hypothetical protein